MNTFKITHIFDDDKFIDTAITLIESVYPGQSDYLVIKNDNDPFVHVKSTLVKSVKLFDENDSKALVAEILKTGSQAVFFHALNARKQKIVTLLPKHIVKVWFVWGFDLYTNWKLFQRFLFEKETYDFIKKGRFLFYFKQKLIFNRFLFALFLQSQKTSYFFPKKILAVMQRNYATQFYAAAKQIDIVVPVIPSEYELIKSLNINPKFAPFTYGSLEEMLQDKINVAVRGSMDILVGNSADPSNNHVDVFKKLSKFELLDRKVFVPLSYGGNPEYIAFVIAKGKQYLGNNFVPLTNFLTNKAYNDLLSNCGFLIFNHLRQQGVGNLIMLGYRGAKIFLHEKSPVFTFYKNLGMHIYSTQTMSQQMLAAGLTESQHVDNQKVFYSNYSNVAVKEKIKTLLKTVQDEITKKQL